jgi:putative ABC transport system permease protein
VASLTELVVPGQATGRVNGPFSHIRTQFLSEAILLALVGGAVGVGLGVLSTAVYADIKGWSVVVPPLAWAGGFGAALIIGAVAGLLPALRAARMSPTEALWTV